MSGFVKILDDCTLAIPDWPGNNRANSMKNLVQNPNIDLIFMVQGKTETLRIRGTATMDHFYWQRGPSCRSKCFLLMIFRVMQATWGQASFESIWFY